MCLISRSYDRGNSPKGHVGLHTYFAITSLVPSCNQSTPLIEAALISRVLSILPVFMYDMHSGCANLKIDLIYASMAGCSAIVVRDGKCLFKHHEAHTLRYWHTLLPSASMKHD